jgi:signal peptidase I
MENVNDNLQQSNKKEKKSSIGFYALLGVMLVLIALFFYLSHYVLMKVAVIGPSMEQTLYDGDVVLVNTKTKKIESGDVVIINLAEEGQNEYLIIKRVIAVGKCTVEIKSDGYVYVDGEKIDEPYLNGALTEASQNFGFCDATWELEEGDIFYLGDNRKVSADSRVHGTCTIDDVYGKVFDLSIKYRETFTKILD